MERRGAVLVPQLERPQRFDRSIEPFAAIGVKQILRLPQPPLDERLWFKRRKRAGDDRDHFRRRPTLAGGKTNEVAVAYGPIFGRCYAAQPVLERAKANAVSAP